MWPFPPRTPLTPDDEVWQRETWAWLLKELGGIEGLKSRPLVLPSKEFFPPTDAEGHERAEHVFESVRALADMAFWQCRLVAQPQRPDARVSDVAYLNFSKGGNPAGTFGVDGNEVVITYDPASVSDPIALIATFAHELAHYLLSSRGAPPGGWDNHEFATDLAVVYLGFGLFGAATAFRYYAGNQSWGYAKAGYLQQAEWTFALAVFFALRDQDVALAKPWLPAHLYSGLARSARYLAAHPEKLAALRSIADTRQQQFAALSHNFKIDQIPD